MARAGVEPVERAGGAARAAALALTAVALGVLLVEVGARAWLGPPWDAAERVLFLSAPNWVADGDALRFAPEAELREVALYGDRVEYDVRFRTNPQGFVDERDYAAPGDAPLARRWAFVGDSFTAGYHGGSPWVPRLRERAAARDGPIELYNLGVSGAGLASFVALLARAERELSFGRVAVLFISGDLLRNPWRPVVSGGRISVCPPEGAPDPWPCEPMRMLVLDDPDASHAQLRARAAASGLVPPPSSLAERLARGSHVAAALARGLAPPAPAREPRGRADLSRWLARLRSVAGARELVLLQIPERDEVVTGAYRFAVGDAVAASGLRYVDLLHACAFTARDYHRVDGHFAARGYDRLLACVGHELGLL